MASAVLLLAILSLGLWLRGPFLDAILAAAVAVGLWEFAGLCERLGAAPPPWVLYPLGVWLLLQFAVPSGVPVLQWGLGGAVVAGLLGSLALRPPGLLRWAAAVAGALYLGLTVGYYLGILDLEGPSSRLGLRIVGVTLASAMAGDTVALFAGSAVGRRPFFPHISPRKTREGAVAGAAATVAVYGAAAPLAFGLAWYHSAALGALVAVAAQGGDLVESALKRSAGVKDSSGLIPGHGGLLDRMDSLVLLGPVVYCYLRLVSI